MRRFVIKITISVVCGLAIWQAHAFLSEKPRKVSQLKVAGDYEKMNLVSCTNNICIQIKSDLAVHGLLGNVSIKKASVFIQDQNTKNSIAKFEGSAFYDIRFGRFYFTEIENSKFKEAYFDQQSGKLFKM